MELLLVLAIAFQAPTATAGTPSYKVRAVNSFLKATDPTDSSQYYCWHNLTEKYRIPNPTSQLISFSHLCTGDEGFYQNCGAHSSTTTSADKYGGPKVLCSGYLCQKEDFFSGIVTYGGSYQLSQVHCNAVDECKNGAPDEKYCSEELEFFRCERPGRVGQTIPISKRCDGIRDCLTAKDEVDCGHTYGLECEWNEGSSSADTIWAAPKDMCDPDHSKEKPESICRGEVDQAGSVACSNSVGTCLTPHLESGVQTNRTIYPLQRCGSVATASNNRLCADGVDQINCTNSDVRFTCTQPVTRYQISLTHRVLCKGFPDLCSDDLNDRCETPEVNCNLHRHLLCNGQPDCPFGLDESNCSDEFTAGISCLRKVRNLSKPPQRLRILKSWVMDGVEDCEGGEDEDERLWKVCHYKDLPKSEYSYNEHQWPCNLTFVCDPDSPDTALLSPDAMCDGRMKEGCPVEADLCRVSRDKNVSVTAHREGTTRRVMPGCLDGGSSKCQEYPWQESFGTETTVIVAPTTDKYACSELYGELYVYAACLGLCQADNITCPLREIDYLTSCPSLPDRTMTLSKENKLVFVEKDQDSFIVKESFPCKNGRCVSYAQVCDLVDDCGDFSDEQNCRNSFRCDSSNGSQEIIKLSQVCDGKIDCSNEMDECDMETCPENAKKQILTSMVLQILGWLIGLPATFINVIVMFRNSTRLFRKEFSSRINYAITVLITVIGFGDFLVGVYLLCISVENLTRREDFCRNERAWLTSTTCEFYGVISTFGSELSVLAMTVTAIYRAYVMRRIEQAKIPNTRFKVKLFLSCVFVLIVSFLIAILPTNARLRENYFFNGYYIENAQLFQDYQRNSEYLPLLQTYYGKGSSEAADTSVESVRRNLERMFREPEESGSSSGLDFKILGFYGSSGTCTFKFFVDNADPQRHYTWFILTLNIVCLLIISISYLSVHVYTQSKAERVGHRQWFGALQRKITLIIFTDFLCWVPFIFVCFLHYIGVVDATSLYPIFSTLVLPINSLINPLLYDSFFSTLPTKIYRTIRRFFMRLAAVARRNSLNHIYSMRSDSMVTKNASTAGVLYNTGVMQLSTNNVTDDTTVKSNLENENTV